MDLHCPLCKGKGLSCFPSRSVGIILEYQEEKQWALEVKSSVKVFNFRLPDCDSLIDLMFYPRPFVGQLKRRITCIDLGTLNETSVECRVCHGSGIFNKRYGSWDCLLKYYKDEPDHPVSLIYSATGGLRQELPDEFYIRKILMFPGEFTGILKRRILVTEE